MIFLRLMLLLVMVSPASAQTIRVGAAISLRDTLGEIAQQYEATGGDRIEFIFGSSGQIAAQIKSGAPIDLFVSAATKQVEDVIEAGLADPATRRNIAGNRLVLIAPTDAADPPDGFAALAHPSVRRIAIGEPTTVPAGQYAMQILNALDLVDGIAGKLVYGKNVRQVLAYVERGEVSAAIVYATDARQSGDQVRIITQADAALHKPVVYPSVVVSSSEKAESARRFQTYLAESQAARAVLVNKGFAVIDDTHSKAAEQ